MFRYVFIGFFCFMSQMYAGLIVGAHRGCDIFHPENTLESIAYVIEKGAKAIEIDCYLTKDNEVVLMHDNTIDRTTTGRGFVESCTLGELKDLDAGVKTEKKFQNQKVPTLGDVFALCKQHDVLVCVEIKGTRIAIVDTIAAIIAAHEMEKLVYIYSFNRSIIDAYLRLKPNYPLHLSLYQLTKAEIEAAKAKGYDLTSHFHSVTHELATYAHETGVELHLWTINSKIDFEYFSQMPIPLILTDTLLTLSEK